MQKKSLFSVLASSLTASPASSDVVKQAMKPLTEIEIMTVAGGPEVRNEPEGPV
jgi:hypothetical protein